MNLLFVAKYALGLPALVALALGGPGRLRAAVALIAAFSAANIALVGGFAWPPMGALARLPLLAPLALLALSGRASLGALGAVATGGLALQLALQNRSLLTVAAALLALAAGGAAIVATDRAQRRWLTPVLLALASLLLAGSGSLVLGQIALALAVAQVAVSIRGGSVEDVSAILAIVLLTLGVLLSQLASPAAALLGLALALRARAKPALGLGLLAVVFQLGVALLIPDIATAG